MLNRMKKVSIPRLILAVFIASLLWFYVDVTVKPDTKVTIHGLEVSFRGEEALNEKGLMLSEQMPATVSLTLTGNRAVVSQLNRNNISIEVNLDAQVQEAGRQKLEYTITYPSSVNMSNVKVTRSVSSIEAVVVKHSMKTIRVEDKFSGSIAKNYFHNEDDFRLYPREITIQGEDSLVRVVDHAEVELTEMNLDHTWEGDLPVKLYTIDGEVLNSAELGVSTSTIHCIFPVSYYKDVHLTVDLVSGGGATKEDVQDLTLTPNVIRVFGTEEVLDNLHNVGLGTVNLGEVVTSFEDTMPIVLPKGVTSADEKTEATLFFRMKNTLSTKKLAVKTIQLNHVPSNRMANVLDESVEVEIRGPTESIKLLRDEYVSLTVDLSDVSSETHGSVELPAQVKVKGMSDVGAMGTYTVSVQLD